MRRITGFGAVAILFFTIFSVVLAQGPFTLGQTSASSGAASSGGVYSIRDAIGEPDAGSTNGGAYQMFGGLALGSAQEPSSTFSLIVNTSGTGTIMLDPPGGVYPVGTMVKLTATPVAGFIFAGWSGAVSSAATSVQVTMDSDKAINATFGQTSPGNHTLTINVQGQGTVTLDPPGNSYTDGQVVKLTATPSVGFNFASWGGAMTGAINPITLTMDGDKIVKVTFARAVSGDTHLYLPMIRR